MEKLKLLLKHLNKHYEETIVLIVQWQISLEEHEQMTESEIQAEVAEGLIKSRETHDKNINAIKESIKFNERKLTIIEKMKTNTVKYIKEEEQKIIEQNDDGLDVIVNQEYSHKPKNNAYTTLGKLSPAEIASILNAQIEEKIICTGWEHEDGNCDIEIRVGEINETQHDIRRKLAKYIFNPETEQVWLMSHNDPNLGGKPVRSLIGRGLGTIINLENKNEMD